MSIITHPMRTLPVCALLLSPIVVAQTQEAVVVTATGRTQAIEDVVAAVEVIDRDALDLFTGDSVADVLRFSMGVQSFSGGSTDRVTLRGFSSNQILVLVDGRRRPSRFGGQNLAAIPTTDVERIEIIRGPKSALYGADAMGGVVNIILRRAGSRNEVDIRMLAGATDDGDRETAQISAGWGTLTERASHRFSTEYRNREPLARDENGADIFNSQQISALAWRGDFSPDVDHSLRWNLEFQDQDDEGMRFQQARGPLPGQRYPGLEQDERWLLEAGANGWLNHTWSYELGISRAESDGAARRQPDLLETTDYRIDQLDLRLHSHGMAHELTFGAGLLHEDIDISINSESLDRENRYALIQDQWRIAPDVSLLAGVRHDDYSDFGDTRNPRIGLLWNPGDWSLRINLGRAFRAPDSIEQFSSFVRGTLLITGNPELGPEQTRSVEAGLTRTLGSGEIIIDAYNNEVKDLISTVPTGETRGNLHVLRQENVDRARLRGIEAQYRQSLGHHWSLHLGYDWLDARDQDTGERLTGRARHRASASMNFDKGKWLLNLRALRLMDFYNSTSPFSAPFDENYARLDVSAHYRIRPRWTLFAGVDNLTDRTDPEAAARTLTSDPGQRYIYLGFRYQRSAP